MHLPARIDAIFKKITLVLQAASARTHLRGRVVGSDADFMDNGLKPTKVPEMYGISLLVLLAPFSTALSYLTIEKRRSGVES